jgi:hypothetical protein
MTPRDVDRLDPVEYAALDRLMVRELKERAKQARQARKGRA